MIAIVLIAIAARPSASALMFASIHLGRALIFTAAVLPGAIAAEWWRRLGWGPLGATIRAASFAAIRFLGAIFGLPYLPSPLPLRSPLPAWWLGQPRSARTVPKTSGVLAGQTAAAPGCA